jgi:uncharacterized membrane protein YfcA
MGWWALVCLAVLLIGVTKSGFGSGVGLMIVPMTAIAMGHTPRGSDSALGLLLPLLVAGDLLAVGQYRRMLLPGPLQSRPTIDVLRRLLPGTVVGLALGGWLLHALRENTELVGALIRIEIGLESIALVSLHWWRQYRGIQKHLMPEPWRSHVTGGFSAVSSTLAHAAGPIVAMYLLPLRLDRQAFVGTSAIYFFILNTAKLPVYWASGMFRHAEWSFTFKFLPLVLAGAVFGKWLNRRMSDKLFTRIVYAVTFCLGWYVLREGVGGLLAR